MNIPKPIVVIVVVLTLAAFSTLSYFAITAYDRANHTSIQACNEVELVKTALRETIEQEATFTATSKVRTAQEKKEGEETYNEILTRFSPHQCGTMKGKHGRNTTGKAHQKQ